MAMERYVARPFYDRPDTDQILVTFGLAIVVRNSIHALVGGRSYKLAIPPEAFGTIPLSGPVDIPLTSVSLGLWRLWVIMITAALVLLVYAIVEYTDFGLIVKAGTQDPRWSDSSASRSRDRTSSCSVSALRSPASRASSADRSRTSTRRSG